jgi:hypothetical protein
MLLFEPHPQHEGYFTERIDMLTAVGDDHFHVYIIPDKTSPRVSLGIDEQYLGIDVNSWYVNKESNWIRDLFSSHMATGSLSIDLGGQKFHAVLGTFELNSGATIAPIFNKPVLQDRVYMGGSISLKVNLAAIKRDNAIATILKRAAKASLHVTNSMVKIGAAEPLQILTSAGEELISGIQDLLDSPDQEKKPLFSSNGLEVTLQPSRIEYSDTYLLFHRGSNLDKTRLSIEGEPSPKPTYDGQLLEDGTWLLILLRCHDYYSGRRDWYDQLKELNGKIQNLILDYASDVKGKKDCLAQFKPSPDGNKTLYDDFSQLRDTIRSDKVISSRQGTSYVTLITFRLDIARRAIKQENAELFDDFNGRLKEVFDEDQITDEKTQSALIRAFRNELKNHSTLGGSTRRQEVIVQQLSNAYPVLQDQLP